MYQVTKRDGEITEFNLTKISEAIRKAFEAREKEYNQDIIDLLALKVTADFEPKIKEHKIAVEDIQDSVESVLIKAGYADVAKGYILYRKQREKIRNLNSTLLDYKEIVDSYVKVTDWRVKENSTVTYSVGGLILSNSGAITANYWLSEIYDEEIGKAQECGYSYPRSFYADRILCRLVFKTADTGRSGRCDGQDHICSGEAF